MLRVALKRRAKLSLPVRGAWVEIQRCLPEDQSSFWSLPVRGAWVEIQSL